MSRVIHLMRKELIELRQDPRLFGIVILAPILQLTMLGYAATTDVKDVPMVVVDADRSVGEPRAAQPVRGVRQLLDCRRASARRDDIDAWLEDGRAWMALSIPAGYGDRDRARRDRRHPGGRGRHRLEFDQRRARLRARAHRRLLEELIARANRRAGAGAADHAGRARLVQSRSGEPRLHDPGHRRAAAARGDDEHVGDGDRAREGAGHARAAQRDAARALGADHRQAAAVRAGRHHRRRARARRGAALVRGADARQPRRCCSR